MQTLSLEVLATIKTPCCNVPYEGTHCPQCRENYAHDLSLLDKFISRKIEYVAPVGYVRDRDGYMHKDRGQSFNKTAAPVTKKLSAHERFIREALKKCRRCGKEKPLMEFKSGNGFMGRQSNCRPCYEIIKLERER
jgi:hypothetical protein